MPVAEAVGHDARGVTAHAGGEACGGPSGWPAHGPPRRGSGCRRAACPEPSPRSRGRRWPGSRSRPPRAGPAAAGRTPSGARPNLVTAIDPSPPRGAVSEDLVASATPPVPARTGFPPCHRFKRPAVPVDGYAASIAAAVARLGHNGPVTPDRSEALFARACAVTPGGVNSPVRAFHAVGGTPRFIRSAAGAWLTDVDGQRVRRPGRLVGTDAARSRPPRGDGGRRATRSRRGTSYGAPDRGRGRAGRGDRRPYAGRAGPLRLLRHRGHDVGDPAGPRLHRPRRRREVRRLLPRPRRRPARLGRLRPDHLRGARHARRTRERDGADPRPALQRPRRRDRRCSPSRATGSPA